MGALVKLLAFARRVRNGAKALTGTVSLGGNHIVSAEHFASSGDDSQPLLDDIAYAARLPGADHHALIGYADPKNAGVAQPGEKRIYARDSSSNVVASVYLQNDGTIDAANGSGSVQVAPDGTITSSCGSSNFSIAPDGTISGSNPVGSFEMQAAGNFVVNGVTILPGGIIQCTAIQLSAGGGMDSSGNITSSGGASLQAGGDVATSSGISLDNHTHPYTWTSSGGSGTTGAAQ